jgi:hypothetical protein
MFDSSGAGWFLVLKKPMTRRASRATGIKQSNKSPSAREVELEFEWNWSNVMKEFPPEINGDATHGYTWDWPIPHVGKATVLFERYDDGWRVEQILMENTEKPTFPRAAQQP